MSELGMTVDYKLVEKAAAEFHLVYGRTLAQWALVEAALYDWFQLTTNMKEEMARSVFYSAKSFAGRADMLEAALATSDHSPEVLKFVGAVVKKARTYSSFRNQITHGEMMLSLKAGDPTAAQYILVQGKVVIDHGISIQELNNAGLNFLNLRKLASDMLPMFRAEHVQSPEQHLALVLALPNQANSKTVQTPSEPEKQPEPPLRDKKAYRAAQRDAKVPAEKG
jgi:hypothetical protein